MSKIMATSGNQVPVSSGTAIGEDAIADSGVAGIFAALFGGMQLRMCVTPSKRSSGKEFEEMLSNTKLFGSTFFVLELVSAVQPIFLISFAKNLPLKPPPKIINFFCLKAALAKLSILNYK